MIPIEIISGREGALKSLHQHVKRCNHPFAVRIYSGILHLYIEFTKIQRIFAVVPDKVHNVVISMARDIAGD